MNQITAVVIYKNGHFLGRCTTPQILNSALFTEGPKPAWLSNLSYCCGGDEGWKLTFSQPNDVNALSGVFIAVGKTGYFVDGAIADVLAKINGCCGDGAAVTPIYDGIFPAVIMPIAQTFTVTRLDTGSLLDYERFAVDYSNWIIDGTLAKTSSNGTTSVYTFNSYHQPLQQGADTIVASNLVFTSNVAPALTGSNVFQVTGQSPSGNYNVKGGTTLALTTTALNADAFASTLGTWSNDSTHIILTTNTTNPVTVVLGQEAP